MIGQKSKIKSQKPENGFTTTSLHSRGFATISLHSCGFTLIELILYVALVSMIFATLVPFAWRIIEGGVKIGVEQEVYSQARYLSQRIKKEIREASSVSVCSTSELYLINPVLANSIRFCYLGGGTNSVTFNQGNPPAPCAGTTRLHSIDTSVTATTFCSDYSGANTSNVQVNFTVSSNYPSSTRKEYVESLTVQVTGETRN